MGVLTRLLGLSLWLTASMNGLACGVTDPELIGHFEGHCANNLAQGHGRASGAAQYEGDFLSGQKHGQGTKTWPNGAHYQGHFVRDKKQGHGRYQWPDGAVYEGDFVADLREGQGQYTAADGVTYRGRWVADAPIGPFSPEYLAHAQALAAHRAALAAPGTTVCRAMRIGWIVQDWIVGTVLPASAQGLTVHIEEPGTHPHLLHGRPVVRGQVVQGDTEWVPCTRGN